MTSSTHPTQHGGYSACQGSCRLSHALLRFSVEGSRAALRGVSLRIQGDHRDWRPVAGRSRPATRMLRLGLLVEGMTGGQDGCVFSGMALCRAHMKDATVGMVMVVPAHEAGSPTLRGLKVRNAPLRELQAILRRCEKVIPLHMAPKACRTHTIRIRGGFRIAFTDATIFSPQERLSPLVNGSYCGPGLAALVRYRWPYPDLQAMRAYRTAPAGVLRHPGLGQAWRIVHGLMYWRFLRRGRARPRGCRTGPGRPRKCRAGPGPRWKRCAGPGPPWKRCAGPGPPINGLR